MSTKETIVLANDHAAFSLKQTIAKTLEKEGYHIINLGTDSSDSVDYPDFGSQAARMVADHKADFGIVLCGTGIGISMAANKIKGIRCALCHDVTDARLAREHNDANMLALGARTTGAVRALDIVEAFLQTPFSQGENHKRRIAKLAKLEQSEGKDES